MEWAAGRASAVGLGDMLTAGVLKEPDTVGAGVSTAEAAGDSPGAADFPEQAASKSDIDRAAPCIKDVRQCFI
ncbi:hypothetical protein D3C81_2032510 [compost metagenome]